MAPTDLIHVASIPAPGGQLSRQQWRQVEKFLEDWKREVLAAAAKHPKGSYQLGYEQVMSFLKLLGRLGTASVPPEGAGSGPTAREAIYWAERFTYHELDDALNAYIGKIKDSVLYNLRAGQGPLELASALYRLTKDSEVNWRAIARTEAVRAMANGRLKACEDMGYDRVWCPPHAGACGSCRRLIENKVFPIEAVRDVTNFGRKQREWVACIPLHPHCRHAWLPYEPEVVEEAVENYRRLEQAGLADDDVLDEMFDTSGQIKPQYRNDPRLRAIKTREGVDDLYFGVLRSALDVVKIRRTERGARTKRVKLADVRVDLYQREPDPAVVDRFAKLYESHGEDAFSPPVVSHREDGSRYLLDGQHRFLGAQKAGKIDLDCDVRTGLSWEDEQRVCRESMGEEVPRPDLAKDFDRDAARKQRWQTGKGHPDYQGGGQALTDLHSPAKPGDGVSLQRARRVLGGKLPPLTPGGVTMHRAHHPDDPHGHEFRAGDWITHDRDHAAHLFPGAPIHSQVVPPEHVSWAGSTEHEWIYKPPHFDEPSVGKGFFDPPQAGRDPAFWSGRELRPEVSDRLGTWAARVFGKGWHKWARLYLAGGATSRQWLSHPERDSDVDLQIVVDYAKLREQRKPWRKLNDHDLHFALVALVKAGLQDVEVVPGIRLDAFIRPEQTADEFEHDARRSGQAVWDVIDHRWLTQGLADDAEVYGDPWLEGVGGTVADAHPEWVDDARRVTELLAELYTEYEEDPTNVEAEDALARAYRALHDARAGGYADGEGEVDHGNFVWQYAVNFGPLMEVKHALADRLGKQWDLDAVWPGAVAKMSPAPAPGTGVEHWITVHPHGPDEPGQPVLVRNNSDGTMSVIGGAGGALNHLRIDRSRRIDDSKRQAKDVDRDKLGVEEPVSDEERKQKEQEFKQRETEARGVIEQVEARKKDVRQRMEEYVRGQVGYRLGEKHIVHQGTGEEETTDASFKEKRDQLKRLRAAALHTLAYGEIDRKDASESPFLTTEKHGDFEGAEGDEKPDEAEVHEPAEENGDTQEPPPDEPATTAEEDVDRLKQKMPKLPPLTPEQAQSFMEFDRELARLNRQQSKARKVLRAGGSHKESLALDYRDADVKEDVAKKVADEVRTDVARSLEETADSRARNPNRTTHQRALNQGAYDSIDAFTHAVLGVSAIPPDVSKLLGPNGAAQLAAHAIRQRLPETGLTMKEVTDKLADHIKRQQVEVGNTALARARSAADTAIQMREERKASEAGDSRWLTSMTRSYEMEKMNEAARLLGMAIGGQEATSALSIALKSPSEDLKVGGFENPAQIKQLGQKAGVKIGDGDIKRVGAGNYTLSLKPERVEGLLHFDQPPAQALRDRLQKLRTPGQLQAEVDRAKETPDMTDTLDDSQARGKLVLTTTAGDGRGCVLAFAPGRGKTHTALAAALQRMNDDGVPHGQGNTWIVCPTTAMAEWAGTIAKNSTRSVQMIGRDFEHKGEGVIESKQRNSRSNIDAQLGAPGDFNIVSQEHLVSLLKKRPDLADQIKAARVITDESQKSKNEKSDRWKALNEFSKHTTERWALSGTTVEKKLKDLGAQYRWANPTHSLSPTAMEEKFGKLGQEPHVLGQDKVQQFREGLDEGLYQLGQDTGALPERLPDQTHKVQLDEQHDAALKKTVQTINETRKEAKARGLKGVSGVEAEGILRKALYDRPDNAIVKSLADQIDASQPFDYAGDENGEGAGTYEPKQIVFSQFVKQLDHVVSELEGRGHKVFFAHGGLSNEENDKVLKGFLEHQGAATLVSSDKNSTARSLQFGKNKGKFQYGATQMHHYSLPDNNATIQQREARIRRKGSAKEVPIQYHRYDAGTPAEVRQQDRLAREARVQDLAGNSEQLVGGKGTLHQSLERMREKALTHEGRLPA